MTEDVKDPGEGTTTTTVDAEPAPEPAPEPNGEPSLLEIWDTGIDTLEPEAPETATAAPESPEAVATIETPNAPATTEVAESVSTTEAAEPTAATDTTEPVTAVAAPAEPETAATTPEAGEAGREGQATPSKKRRTRQEAPAASPAPAAAAPEPAPAAAAMPESEVPTFEDLGLSGALLRSIRDVGYEEPTPIQVRVLPVLLDGKDVIAQAQTGSGKTAAFGLPIIEAIDPKLKSVQALILCPTRELAIQVSEALHKYGKHKEIETLPIYGGQPYERQFRGLQRGVQIVVGTPGRVMDHMRRGTLNLDNIRFFVLDEADEMLDMGFIEDIEWILEQVPAERQSALFSATMPPRIADLARRYMRDPQRISVTGKEMTVTLTQQMFYEVPRARKVDALTRILDAETPTSAMIFCRTKIGVDELGESLLARGYTVETLHGDLSQAQRDRVMRRFRSGQADILIATDVAARGLDIPEVSHVINFDAPESAEAYVHRIGRTGRAGRTGAAITLVTPREVRWLRQIERITKAKIEGKRLPTIADVAERRREMLKQRVLDILSNPDEYQQYVDTIDDLAEERDAVDVAAAVLKLYADETGRGTPEQQEDDIATFSAATAPRARGEAGMVRLFLNAGRNQGVRPQDVVGAIANEAGIPGRAIGAIDILDTYTFVDIPNEFVNKVLAGMQNSSIKGRRVNIEIAKPAEAGGPAGSGGRGRGGRRDDRPRDDRRGGQGRGGGAQGPYVGGVRVTREGDEQRPPGHRDRKDQGGGGGPRRYDRTGPARFRVRRED